MLARLINWLESALFGNHSPDTTDKSSLCPTGSALEGIVFSHGVYGGEATSDAINALYKHIDKCSACTPPS